MTFGFSRLLSQAHYGVTFNGPSCMRGEKKENILSSEHGATGQFESHLYGYEA